MAEQAMLAPVPCVHLEDGHHICAERGEVAFGTRDWDFFGDRRYAAFPVLIYASLGESDSHELYRGLRVSWVGRYVRYVDAIPPGRHPEPEFRPPSTAPEDAAGWALGFWHVADLRPLLADQQVQLTTLRAWKSQRNLAETFRPRGPLLIEWPTKDLGQPASAAGT